MVAAVSVVQRSPGSSYTFSYLAALFFVIVIFCVLSLWHASRFLPGSQLNHNSPAHLAVQLPVMVRASVPSIKEDTKVDDPSETARKDAKNDHHIVIGHVISLITCQKATRVQGFLDALVILRHSIHQNSVHNNNNSSKYGYQMYAIVHPDGGCVAHLPLLKRLGYIPLVKPTPVNISSITTHNDWYRQHVEGENCCGSAEFIKLYAYTLTQHPVVVHWDLDVAVLRPLDDLYDSMLLSEDASSGRAARARLQIQHRSNKPPLPTRIDAFFTRDVTSAQPWESVQAVQGGFVVARPNIEHFRMYQKFIQQANYTPGRGPTSGWGGMVGLLFESVFVWMLRLVVSLDFSNVCLLARVTEDFKVRGF